MCLKFKYKVAEIVAMEVLLFGKMILQILLTLNTGAATLPN